MKNPKELDYHW